MCTVPSPAEQIKPLENAAIQIRPSWSWFGSLAVVLGCLNNNNNVNNYY